MTTKEAAYVIGCTRQQVTKLIRQGKLQAKIVNYPRGPVYDVDKDSVERYATTEQTRGFPRGMPRRR